MRSRSRSKLAVRSLVMVKFFPLRFVSPMVLSSSKEAPLLRRGRYISYLREWTKLTCFVEKTFSSDRFRLLGRCFHNCSSTSPLLLLSAIKLIMLLCLVGDLPIKLGTSFTDCFLRCFRTSGSRAALEGEVSMRMRLWPSILS